MTLATISYFLSALAFAGLAIWLLLSWRGRFVGAALIVAVVLTAAWAGLIAYATMVPTPTLAVEVVEVLRSGAWLLFVSLLLYPMRHLSSWLRVLLLGSSVLMAGALFLVPLVRLMAGIGVAPYPSSMHVLFVMFAIGMALLGLILLEQLYRNLSENRRWALKFLCIALGTLFAYDLYLYSHALLFQEISIAAWDARGLINAVAAPLILIAARRNDEWSLSVYVSRHVAFHTTAMVAAGLYLIVVSVGGYYVRDFGGTWGEFAQILFIALAAIALLAFMASEVLRRRLRVLINKHFFSRKYDYRLEWLRLTHRLADTSDGLDPYQRALAAVAGVVDSRGAAMWRKSEEEFALTGQWNVRVDGDSSVAIDAPLPKFLENSAWIMDVSEYRQHPDRYQGVELPAALSEIPLAWAVVPLFRHEELRGFILLSRPKAEADITWEDRDVLKAIGLQVESYLGQHEDAQALSRARQFEAFNQLTTFLMHDLKNLIAQQSLIVRNAEKHKHNPEFVEDAFETIGNSVQRMERLLEHLQRRRHSGTVENVHLHQLLDEVARRCQDRRPEPTLDWQGQELMVEAERDAAFMIFMHLIRNAQDATAVSGQVAVTAIAADGQVIVEVADTGEGMTREFIRDHLFQPFVTTKSSKGMGIGAHQVREFVRAAGGRVNVWSTPGEGTMFRVTLPALPVQAGAPAGEGIG